MAFIDGQDERHVSPSPLIPNMGCYHGVQARELMLLLPITERFVVAGDRLGRSDIGCQQAGSTYRKCHVGPLVRARADRKRLNDTS